MSRCGMTESIKSDQTLVQELNFLYEQRDSVDFLKQLDLLESPEIKDTFLNTIELIDGIRAINLISECCHKPLYLNLSAEHNQTVLDLLFVHCDENDILAALKNNRNFLSENIWSVAVKKNHVKVIIWLTKNDIQHINAPNENGFTPGALAVLMGHKDLANMLREEGAYFGYITNEKGHTLWHIAAIGHKEDLIKNCIDCELPINILDREGYTAAYYLLINRQNRIKQSWKEVPGFYQALVSDAFNAIRKNNIVGLNAILMADISASSKNVQGYTLLDMAFIVGNNQAIEILNEKGAKLRLYDNLDSQKNYLTLLNEPQDKYVINVNSDNYDIQIKLNHLDATGQLISSISFSPWGASEKAKAEGKWRVLTKDNDTCYVLITKDETATEPDLFCEISRTGALKLQYANTPGASLQLTTDADFIFDSIAAVKNLDIQAKDILFTEDSKVFNGHALKLTANQVNLHGTHTFEETEINSAADFIQSGDFVSELFSLKSESVMIAGQLMVSGKAKMDAALNFKCEGSIVLGKSGDIKAHVLDISKHAQIVVQQGELRLYGTAKLENSGAIIGDQLFLSSGLMLTNNHGGLIKGLTCILRAPQTNQGGFLLSGQKSTLSYVDWGLSFAQAGIKVAELSAYITAPTAISLRGYLLASKTLHRAADIFYRAVVNGEDINHSELVTLIIDNVIPCIGNISNHEEQARVLVNILYQCYGNYQSEEAFVHKSLLAIEAVTRFVNFSTAGRLNEENVLFLQTAAEYIKYSRIGLKAAEISVEAIRAVSSDDVRALEKARASFATMAEMAIREYAYSLKPITLFNSNIQLPARDLAILALNKGYNADLFFQNLVFGMLHAAKQQGLVTTEASLYAETAIRGVLKAGNWYELYQSYEEGNLSKRTIANEAINSLLFILGNPLLRDQFISKPTELAESAETEAEVAAVETPPEAPTQAPEPEPEALSEEKLARQKIINASFEEINVLQEKLKDTKTQEARDEINIQIDELRNKISKNSKVTIPDRVLVDINIDPLKYVEGALNQKPSTEENQLLGYERLQAALVELQKAFNGEYAPHGYLGAFSDFFHNDELIDTVGHASIYAGHSGTNTGQIHATGAIGLFGQDIHNRTSDNKIISDRLAHIVNSQFKNFETGVVSAQDIISSYCVGLLDNLGAIDSHTEVRVVAARILKNHETGLLIAKKEVNLLCDLLSENKGLMSGETVTLEGTKNGALNSGTIYGVDKIRLISEKLASNEATGELIAPQVVFESQEFNKEGAIAAALVSTLGYGQANPDKTTWKKNADDSIGALLLKSNAADQIEPDAFANVSFLDVTLPEPLKDELSFMVSPDFANILQLHFPQADTIIPMKYLPQLSDDATLILDAPGHDLDATGHNTYNSHFRFTGNQVLYSGGNTSFSQTAFFAVNKMVGQGGETNFYIEKGGFVQAEQMLNKGLFHSDGIMNWNLKNLDNDADLEKYTQYFYHNKYAKDHNILTPCESTRVIADSGVIYALGHRGHLGEFNQHGGVFLSGEEGSFVYHSGGNQRAILTHEGRQTADVIEDGGQNWHSMPVFKNAAINSTGQNTFIGKEALFTKGLDFEGDKGCFLYAEQGIKEIVESAAYHIPATESRTRQGKFERYVHQDERGDVNSQNSISSEQGDVNIVAPEGSIQLEKTIVDAKNATIIARDKVTIEGANNETHYKDRKKRQKLFRSKRTKSETTETKIERSYIFTNENLTICCEELVLNATWVKAQGDFLLITKTATLDGKQQTFDNKTKTTEYSFSMPAVENLQAILKGKNAKDMFGKLMRSFGWNEQELQKILHAKSVGELPGPAVRFARDTFNLTAFVSHACGEFDKSPTELIGAITDKLGLTTLEGEKRIPNPRFNFKVTKTKEQTHASQSVPTEIMVGGTFSMLGNTLHLREGSRVEAEHLRVFLVEGIKATYGTETLQYSRNTQSASLGVSALNPYDVEIALGLSKEYKYDETHHNAKLHARSTAEVHAGQTIEGNLQIEGNDGHVTAPNMNFQSSQDTHITKTFETSLNVSTTGSSAGASMQKGKKEEYTTAEYAGIVLKNGKVCVDNLNLENGSQVITKQLHRADGAEGLPAVTGSDAIDSKVEKSKGFGIQVQPAQGANGDPSGGVNYLSEKQETIHRATVIADNVAEGSLPGINTDASKQSEVITDKRKAFDLEGSKSEVDKLTEVGKQSMHFLYKPATIASIPVPQQESQTYSSLSSDNSYMQKGLESQHNDLFGESLDLEKENSENPKKQTPAQVKKQKKPKKNTSDSTKNIAADIDPALSRDEIDLSLAGGKILEQKIVGNLPQSMRTHILSTEIKPMSCTTEDCNDFSRSMYLNQNHDALTIMYIAAERSVVSTGQGIKQFALNLGEKADLAEEGATIAYTKKINKEAAMYKESLVGQSKLAKATGMATDVAIAIALPEVKALSLGKIGQAAVSGLIQNGLAPTEDGSLSSNAKNAAIGAVTGAGQALAMDKAGKVLNKMLKKSKVEKPHSAANDAQYGPFSPKFPPRAANDVQYGPLSSKTPSKAANDAEHGPLSSKIPPVKTKAPEDINKPPKKPIVFSNQAKAIVKPTPKNKEDATQNTKNANTQASEKAQTNNLKKKPPKNKGLKK